VDVEDAAGGFSYAEGFLRGRLKSRMVLRWVGKCGWSGIRWQLSQEAGEACRRGVVEMMYESGGAWL